MSHATPEENAAFRAQWDETNARYKAQEDEKRSYLVALPAFPGAKGFCHPTILVKARDEREAREIVRHLRPTQHIGEIKKQG